MTEIPSHLLDRTRSRRQALGLPVAGGDGGGAGASGGGAVAVPAGGGVAPAGGSNLPKGPAAPSGPVEKAKAPAKPPAPYVEAYQRRKKIPMWAMPVLAIMPVWAVLFAGTMEPPKSRTLTLVQAGAGVYGGGAGCAGCHGGTGGGGVGPQLSGGVVVRDFANPIDQVRWIILGSADPRGKALYESIGKVSKGGMPGFGETLSLTEIVEVTLHERLTLSGGSLADEAEAWADLRKIPEEYPEFGFTEEEVELLLEEIAAQNGVVIPAAAE